MPLWLGIVIAAHLLYAIVFLADHIVMKQSVKDEYAYTFYISILSGFALVVAPFGATVISPGHLITALAAGASFSIASLFFFKSLKHQQASYVAPFVGGLVPVFTMITAFFIGIEVLPSESSYIPFSIALLIVGSFLIGWNAYQKKGNLSYHDIEIMVIASAFYGISFATIKLLFAQVSFIDGFMWSRLGMVLVGVLFLFFPEIRKAITTEKKRKRTTFQWVVLSNKLFSIIASTSLLYAISIANPAVINAMQGIQYVFLIAIVALFGKRYSRIIGEKLFGKSLLITAAAVGCILTGLVFLAI